jgi:hypothetical protein
MKGNANLINMKGDEATGDWRNLNNELHNLYALPNIISAQDKDDETDRTCSTNRGEEDCI